MTPAAANKVTLELPGEYSPGALGVDDFIGLMNQKTLADQHYMRLLAQFMIHQLSVMFQDSPDLEIVEIDGEAYNEDFLPQILTTTRSGADVDKGSVEAFEELMGGVALPAFEFLGAHSPIHRDTLDRMLKRTRELSWAELCDTDGIAAEERMLLKGVSGPGA